MVILSKQIPFIWQGIFELMKIKNIPPSTLSRLTRFSEESIKKGIRGEYVQLTSDDLPSFVEAFGLSNTRNRNFEDFVDILTDEECIQLLTEPLTREQHHQNMLWDLS